MDRGKIAGGFLCFFSFVMTVVFLWGLVLQAWWAVAIPVAVLVVVSMTLLFWVGWTFLTTDVEPAQPTGGVGPGEPPV